MTVAPVRPVVFKSAEKTPSKSQVFRREVLPKISIEENQVGFEPEITAKVAKQSWRVYEVGISCSGRTHTEGKIIRWKDGVSALRCILKYNLFR